MRDTKEEVRCPACGCEMSKLYIEEYDHYVDICADGCGGILFDNREFQHFDEQHENIDMIVEKLQNKDFQKVDETKTRICPVCEAPMVKNYSSANQKIQIDECYTCGAKFLDYKELEAIREEFPTEEERAANFNMMFGEMFGEVLEKAELERQKGIAKRSIFRQLAVKLFRG